MSLKVTVYFNTGRSVEITAKSLDFTGDSLAFFGEDGRLFATFSKEYVAGWIMERL